MTISKSLATRIVALSIVFVLLVTAVLAAFFTEGDGLRPNVRLSAMAGLPGITAEAITKNPVLPRIERVRGGILVHYVSMIQNSGFLNEGDIVQTGETGAMHLAFDGATVTIAPNSKMVLTSVGTRAGVLDVKLTVLDGSIFVDIYRPLINGESFEVHTPASIIPILGTAVQISHNALTDISEVSLLKGTVRVICLASDQVFTHSVAEGEDGLVVRICEAGSIDISITSPLVLEHLTAVMLATLLPDSVWPVDAVMDIVSEALPIALAGVYSENVQALTSDFWDFDVYEPIFASDLGDDVLDEPVSEEPVSEPAIEPVVDVVEDVQEEAQDEPLMPSAILTVPVPEERQELQTVVYEPAIELEYEPTPQPELPEPEPEIIYEPQPIPDAGNDSDNNDNETANDSDNDFENGNELDDDNESDNGNESDNDNESGNDNESDNESCNDNEFDNDNESCNDNEFDNDNESCNDNEFDNDNESCNDNESDNDNESCNDNEFDNDNESCNDNENENDNDNGNPSNHRRLNENEYQLQIIEGWDHLTQFLKVFIITNTSQYTIYEWQITFEVPSEQVTVNFAANATVSQSGVDVVLTGNQVWRSGASMVVIIYVTNRTSDPIQLADIAIYSLLDSVNVGRPPCDGEYETANDGDGESIDDKANEYPYDCNDSDDGEYPYDCNESDDGEYPYDCNDSDDGEYPYDGNESDDGEYPYDGNDSDDGEYPYDGNESDDGEYPYDGNESDDGEYPYDGNESDDGEYPYDCNEPDDGEYPYDCNEPDDSEYIYDCESVDEIDCTYKICRPACNEDSQNNYCGITIGYRPDNTIQ